LGQCRKQVDPTHHWAIVNITSKITYGPTCESHVGPTNGHWLAQRWPNQKLLWGCYGPLVSEFGGAECMVLPPNPVIGVYHDCRLKYDKHICLIVHNAYKRAVLILKCFHTGERDILKLAFITYVRPLLEFSC